MVSELEIERTFLASSIPEQIKKLTPVLLRDVYIPDGEDGHPILRLRQKGAKFEITKKVPASDDKSLHDEHTIELSQVEFAALASSSSREVSKNRYVFELGGRQVEVDVFIGGLVGLVLIDFEFDSEDERDDFVPPRECLVDVTQEEFIAGGLLAGKSYEDIEERLVSFGYKKLMLE